MKHSITFTEEIRLKYDQNDIRLEFVALNYTAPEQNQFEYQLIGYDEDWQSTGAVNPYATYTNLESGEYTFQVRGANNDGHWNLEGTTLSIIITPPWWATLWAYFLYALIVFSIIALIYRFQLNRRLAEAEARRLQELDSAKTRLYTNITHEFRTPLTVIEGMADQIREDPKQWFGEGLDLIKRNNRRLLELVNQMLALRKLESGNMPVQMVHGDVVNYLRYVMESFHAHAESKDIRLHFLCEQEKIDMDYDPEKLQTIVSNLLSNAIKFTPAGGNVYLQVRIPTSNHLLLSVKDTGAGIPEDQLPHIFDRFYQADSGSTREVEGTGIGLTLTRELVRLLGGDINVDSKSGKGATFTVLLPVTKEVEKVNASETIRPAVQTAAHGAPTAPESNFLEGDKEESKPPSDLPRALIVEDNQDVTRYLQACLRGQYHLETADDGQKGIEKAIETIPDIIISDVMMPGKDGYEVCRTLRQDFRTSHIPILLLTAKADRDSKLEGLEQGADAYLTKPFDKTELEVRLRKLIELRRQLQERYGQKSGFLKPGKSPAPADSEDAFLLRLRETVEANISDENYGISELCRDLAFSRTQLHRKLRALTGQSTSHHIRSIRLERARELLETTGLNVSEVAYEVGFSSLSYFSQVFSKYHGRTPTEVRKRKNNG